MCMLYLAGVSAKAEDHESGLMIFMSTPGAPGASRPSPR
jgi:hypothetical protein